MLPGFRILLATIALSASVLIFGLGAAALLRSAHEEFVGIPAWRAAQQPLAPAMDTNRPMLALVRVDPPAPLPADKAESEIKTPPRIDATPKDDKSSGETKTASVDSQATDKAIVAGKSAAEISKLDEIGKPRVRQSKRARAVKTLRHWSARTPRTVQPQQQSGTASFTGFDAPDAAASSGAGSNRRTAGRSPF